MTETSNASAALFAGKDEIVQVIYMRLLEALHTIGPVQEDPKKTSIHLVHTNIKDFPANSLNLLELRRAKISP